MWTYVFELTGTQLSQLQMTNNFQSVNLIVDKDDVNRPVLLLFLLLLITYIIFIINNGIRGYKVSEFV